MKATISKEEMQSKLSDIQSIIEKKTTMPILSHFLMDIKKKKSTIYATDLEMAIKEPLSLVSVEKEGKFCVPARKLFEIAREVDEDITIESTDNNWLKLRSGKSNFRIACLNTDDYPLWPVIEDYKRLVIDSKTLFSMIDKTIYCAGENDTRYTLNSIFFHIVGEKKRFYVIGTDGHRLACIYKDLDIAFGDELKMIVPRKAAAELKRILSTLEEDIIIEVTKNHIRFTMKDRELLTKLIDGAYPNYEQVIPKDNKKVVKLNRDDFIRTLRRVSVISKDRSHIVKFEINEIKDGEINIIAVDPEIGEANERLSVEYKGEPVTLGLNAKYILEVLSSMEETNVIFSLQDTVNPTLLKEEGNESYSCVVMPMRI